MIQNKICNTNVSYYIGYPIYIGLIPGLKMAELKGIGWFSLMLTSTN